MKEALKKLAQANIKATVTQKEGSDRTIVRAFDQNEELHKSLTIMYKEGIGFFRGHITITNLKTDYSSRSNLHRGWDGVEDVELVKWFLESNEAPVEPKYYASVITPSELADDYARLDGEWV